MHTYWAPFMYKWRYAGKKSQQEKVCIQNFLVSSSKTPTQIHLSKIIRKEGIGNGLLAQPCMVSRCSNTHCVGPNRKQALPIWE